MLSRLAKITLWKYPDDVTYETLARHYRWAGRICMVGWGSMALMTSSIAEVLISPEGWLQKMAVVILIASGTVAGLMILPTILAEVWVREIEKEMQQRGWSFPEGKRMAERVGRSMRRIMYFFIVAVLIASVAKRS